MNHIADANKMVGEDHLRDATKMVSDTPRTTDRVVFIDGNPWVNAPFARGLERELNAANQRIKRLEEFVDQLTNPKFTRDDLPKEALLQYINRLEEAGQKVEDAAYSVQDWSGTALGDALDELNKAKEAKP